MDWKRHYADELNSPAGRHIMATALATQPHGDSVVTAALRAGGIVSFPHVTLRDSATPLMRVAQSILDTGTAHVLALGVLHGGALPPAYRAGWQELNGGSSRADERFADYAGAFFDSAPVQTPDGPIACGPLDSAGATIRERPELLAGEFSLDLFLAVLAAASRARGVRPPAVSRLYVGATRAPAGHFEVACAMADEIASRLDKDTVCVTTGDLAHVGHGYTPPDEWRSLPGDAAGWLEALTTDLMRLHHAALVQHDDATAWSLGTLWRSDQCHLLPVISRLVGPNGRFELLSLALSDYSVINDQPRPCLVAAALGLFHRGVR